MMTTGSALGASPIHDYVRGPQINPIDEIKNQYEAQLRAQAEAHSKELAAAKENFKKESLDTALDLFSKDQITAADLKAIKKFFS